MMNRHEVTVWIRAWASIGFSMYLTVTYEPQCFGMTGGSSTSYRLSDENIWHLRLTG
jgi:hypothetical protein